MNNVKESTQHRVCLIDFYPSFLVGLKNAYNFSKKHSIPFKLEGKNALDTQKLLYHFCMKEYCDEYSRVKSEFPKVMVFYPIKQESYRKFNTFIQKMVSVLPIPVLKSSNFNTPDNFYGAINALENNKSKKDIKRFANKLKLYMLSNIMKKNSNFSRGTVDYTSKPD